MTLPCCASGSYTVGFRFGFYCVVIFHYPTFLATFSPPLSGSTGAECADDSIHHGCGDPCTFPGGRVVEQPLKPFIDLFGSLTILGNPVALSLTKGCWVRISLARPLLLSSHQGSSCDEAKPCSLGRRFLGILPPHFLVGAIFFSHTALKSFATVAKERYVSF